jgi:hypothetical protein
MAIPVFAYIISLVVISNPAAIAAVQSESYASIFGAENPTAFKNALLDYLEDTLTSTTISTKYLVHETSAATNERSLINDYYIENVFSNLVNAVKLEILLFLGTTSSSTFKVDVIQNSIVVQSKTITVTSSTTWNIIQLNNPISGTVKVKITGISTHTGDRVPTFNANTFQTVDGAVVSPSSAYRHQYQWVETINSQKWVCDKFEPDLCWWQPYSYTVTHTDWTTETINEVPAIRFSNQDLLLWKYTVKDAINDHFPIKKEYFVNGILNSVIEKAYVDYPSYDYYKVIIQGVNPDFTTPDGSLDQLLAEFMVEEGLSSESMDVDGYLTNLMTVISGPTDYTLEDSVYQQSKTFLNQLKKPYNATHGESYLISKYYPQGSLESVWGLFRQLDWYEQVCIKPVNNECPLMEYKTVHKYSTVEKMGDLKLGTELGFPQTLETIILAKATDMVTYPVSPYFFTWLALKTQQIRGTTFSQNFMADLASSTPISPLLNVDADLVNPYQAAITLTDTHGYNALGTVAVEIQDAFGTVKGEGTVYNGSGYIPATTAQFTTGDKAVVIGSGFYLNSQAVGTITQKTTTTNVSLVLDPESATGVNPFVADITIKDSTGNMVMGDMPVTLRDTNGNYVTSGTVQNGTARITLPNYRDNVQVTTGNNVFYGSSAGSATVQYDLPGMIQTLGPAGSDPVANAKFKIIRNYIETSGAFSYDTSTGNYTMNGNDGVYMWTDTIYNVQRGYQLAVNKPISTQELESGQFDSQTFKVVKYWASGGGLGQWQESTMFTLTKMQFFDLWLGQKLQPTAYGADQPDPSGFTRLNSLASDFSIFLSKDKNYFETDSEAQTFSAKVRGLLDTATRIGFPTPAGVLEQLADFVNGIIGAFIDAITAVWNAIVSFVGAVANFVITVWNNVVGPVLGAAIEVVKSVAVFEMNLIIDILFDVIIGPQLPDQNFQLPQNFINLITLIFDNVESLDLFSALHLTLDPFTGVISDTKKVVPNFESSISSLDNTLGIFKILDQLGGVYFVNIAMEAISNRIIDRATNLFSNFQINESISLEFVDNNPIMLTNEQNLAKFGNLGSDNQDSLNKYLKIATDGSGNQIAPEIPLLAGNIQFSTVISSNDIDQLISWIITGIGSILGGLRGKIPNLRILGQIGIAIGFALILSSIFALFLTVSDLFYEQTINYSSLVSLISNLPEIFGSILPQATNIITYPLMSHSAYVQGLGSAAWIQGIKMTDDIFTILKTSPFAKANGWSLAFQTAKFVILSLFGLYFTKEYSDAKSILDQKQPPTFLELFDSPTAIMVNFVSSFFSTITNFAVLAMEFKYFKFQYMDNIGSFIKLFGLVGSFLLRTSKLKINDNLDWIIYFSSVFSDLLKGLVLAFKIPGKNLPPKILVIAGLISFFSDFAQYGVTVYWLSH